MANTARLPVYTSRVPPPSDEHPFEPHVRRFEDYSGEWTSESEDETFTMKQLDACEARFKREKGQIKRNASLFAVVNPAYGHNVLPQHARLLNKMQEI